MGRHNTQIWRHFSIATTEIEKREFKKIKQKLLFLDNKFKKYV